MLMTSSPDKSELKERERKTWAAVAAGWRRRDELLTRGAAPVTERMLKLAGIRPGHQVLDIASGLGEPAITAAGIVGDAGRVIGTDLVEDMVRFAGEKAARAGLANIEFHCIDGEALDFAPATFDAATLRWGLMFMPEPELCLRKVHGMLKDGGRIALACWAAPEYNPFVGLMIKVLSAYMELPQPSPGAPGIFAFADPERLREVITSAGFGDVQLEEMAIDVIEVDNGNAYWETMSDLAGPVMTLVNQLDAATRAAYIEDVIKTAEALMEGPTLKARGITWIASAVK